MAVRDIVQAAAGVGGGAGEAVYVEDVFSTYLYTGIPGSTQTITNGIDLLNEGGLVVVKNRESASVWYWKDTINGAGSYLRSDTTAALASGGDGPNQFNDDGFDCGSHPANSHASWTFRKAPKFFDVVTGTTGSDTNYRISHNLGSVPGCIIFKRTDAASTWSIWHRSLSSTTNNYLKLGYNATDAQSTRTNTWGTSGPTDTDFGIDTTFFGAGISFVAYLFAHDAGGFGDDGEQSIIKCGSFSAPGGNLDVDLGFEPQWMLVKRYDAAEDWWLFDTMRGFSKSVDIQLKPNTSDAESNTNFGSPQATGFNCEENTGSYIYIAIRRGPMKTPTSGTEVFNSVVQSPQSAGTLRTVGFPADLIIGTYRNAATPRLVNTRLTGFANNSGSTQNTPSLQTDSTGAESNRYPLFYDVWNTTAKDGDYIYNSNGINWLFHRAPGFFDVVAYTGTGVARTVNHNLGVAPELIIIKARSTSQNWGVIPYILGNNKTLRLNSYEGVETRTDFTNNVASSSSVFTLGTNGIVNGNAVTYIAFLFATLAGVSKIGTYNGTGADLNVDCGFSAGARFILIKRTDRPFDAADNWYVWDSVRGIVSGNDPYLLLNSTATEVTSTDYIDPLASGFTVTSSAPAALNASGGNYIFLAIA